MRTDSRSPSARVIAGALALVATAAAFLQIERGIGDVHQSLLYVAHNLMITGALAIFFLLLTRRPWTSALAGLAIVLLIWFASRLKVAATDVPALASDLPRILDTWDVVLAFGWPVLVAAGVGAILLGVLVGRERPMSIDWPRRFAGAAASIALLAGSGAIQARIPVDDDDVLTNNGPKIAQFVRSIYATPDFRDARFPDLGPYCCFRNEAPPRLRFGGAVMPNVVVVLQESTFPPENLRGLTPVRNRLLEGAAPLRVDVIGGGTWVEEYALLHGVPPSVYGRDFMQVLWLGRRLGLEGRLAPMLAAAGYRTVSVLPAFAHELGDSGEMQRSLGFERVVDCPKIDGCERGGAWTSVADAALYAHALKELRAAETPAFVYVATMRQHSPHVSGYPKRAYRDEIVAEYLRRLDASATEADDFLRELKSLARPTVVLMFGDHIATDVNSAFSQEEFRRSRRHTFFNLYDATGEPVAGRLMDAYRSVEAPSTAFLDAILLRFAGFESDYIDRKLAMMQACGGVFCVKPEDGSQVDTRGAPQ